MPASAFTLIDGRTLEYYEYGDPTGDPVLYCHGGLMDATDIAWADTASSQMGIRLISANRPGIGNSTLQKHRTLLDWPGDIEQLADRLEIAKFAVVGWSMGGQYALACAYALPKRVSHVSLVASCVDISNQSQAKQLNVADSKLSKLSNRAPWAAQLVFAGMRTGATYRSQDYLKRIGKGLSRSDQQALQDESKVYITSMRQALQQTRGMTEEYRTFIKPWGFKPQDITKPVAVWQGAADTLVPAEWATQLADDLPKSDLHLVEGAGHFLLQQQFGNVVAIGR